MVDIEPEITVLETTPAHLHLMAEAMDEQSTETAKKIGISPKKALWNSFRKSTICMTAFIDDRIAAIWGVSGTVFSEVGQPWLVLSPEVTEHPFKVCFRYRKELNKFQNMFPVLEEYVDSTNTKAIRLLELMGFTVNKDDIPYGNAVLYRAERRKLS